VTFIWYSISKVLGLLNLIPFKTLNTPKTPLLFLAWYPLDRRRFGYCVYIPESSSSANKMSAIRCSTTCCKSCTCLSCFSLNQRDVGQFWFYKIPAFSKAYFFKSVPPSISHMIKPIFVITWNFWVNKYWLNLTRGPPNPFYYRLFDFFWRRRCAKADTSSPSQKKKFIFLKGSSKFDVKIKSITFLFLGITCALNFKLRSLSLLKCGKYTSQQK